MNSATLLNALEIIKNHDKPPFNKDDIYYQRAPWQKFGTVSSGICQCWCWYQDSVIVENVSEDDVVMALKEFGWDITQNTAQITKVPSDGKLNFNITA